MIPQRQTAHKVWISSILNGTYVQTSGEFEPNYVEIHSRKLSRVNILGTVILKDERENYASLSIDDGSGVIKVKSWNEDTEKLAKHFIGDLLLIIGKPRLFGNEKYILPEILKKYEDPLWSQIRKLELKKLWGEPKEVGEIREQKYKETNNEEEIVVINKRQKLLNIIERKGTEEGISYEELRNDLFLSEKDFHGLVEELIKEGEIFEPKKGWLKLIV